MIQSSSSKCMGWNDDHQKKGMLQKKMFVEFTEEEKKIIELLRKNEYTGYRSI